MSVLRIILIIVFLIAAFAVTVIVLCQKGKSAGLGSLSGAGSNNDSYWNKNKKYSLEGKLERGTKIAAAVLVLSALAIMLIPNTSSSNNIAGGTTSNSVGEEGQASTEESTDSSKEETTEEASPTPSTEASPETSESTTKAE